MDNKAINAKQQFAEIAEKQKQRQKQKNFVKIWQKHDFDSCHIYFVDFLLLKKLIETDNKEDHAKLANFVQNNLEQNYNYGLLAIPLAKWKPELEALNYQAIRNLKHSHRFNQKVHNYVRHKTIKISGKRQRFEFASGLIPEIVNYAIVKGV